MLVLALIRPGKSRRAGSNAVCCRIHRRRAWRMSGRFCSLARRVFFYMSGPSAPTGNGWLEECSARSGPGAFPPASDRVCGPAFAAVVAGGCEPVWALGRRSDGAGAGRRCGGVAARLLTKPRGNTEAAGDFTRVPLLLITKQPKCVHANPGDRFSHGHTLPQALTQWLQFYLKFSRSNRLRSVECQVPENRIRRRL